MFRLERALGGVVFLFFVIANENFDKYLVKLFIVHDTDMNN